MEGEMPLQEMYYIAEMVVSIVRDYLDYFRGN